MNNDHKRLFVASSELFSGFKVHIDIRYIDTLDDIVNIFLSELRIVLKANNFENLMNKIVDKEFHIHSYTMEQILTSNKDVIFFVCNHCPPDITALQK
jgi:hypothetical protein